MPFTPSSAAQGTAALAGSNQASLLSPLVALRDSISGGNLAPAALFDAILSSVGFQAQDSSLQLGNASTSSTSFSDIGNGSSTGFSSYTFVAPIAKTYLVTVDLATYMSVSVGPGFNTVFQLVNSTTSTNYTNAGMTLEGSVVNNLYQKSFSAPVAMSIGNNVLKIQWKVSAGCTANTNLNSFRTFTVTG